MKQQFPGPRMGGNLFGPISILVSQRILFAILYSFLISVHSSLAIFLQGACLQRTPLSMLSLFCPTAEMWPLLSSQPRHSVVPERNRRSCQWKEIHGPSMEFPYSWSDTSRDCTFSSFHLELQPRVGTSSKVCRFYKGRPMGRHMSHFLVRQCPPC